MIHDVFRDKLLDGEEVVWSGQPGQGIIWAGRDAIMVPFSLMWGGFAVFLETKAVSNEDAPFLMKLWGVPFVLAGIYITFGRFVVDAYIRKGLYYAVTNQRILIMRSRPFYSFLTLSIDRLPELRITQSSTCQGTIYFGAQYQTSGRPGFGSWTLSLESTPKFLAIDNAQDVFELIQRTVHQT